MKRTLTLLTALLLAPLAALHATGPGCTRWIEAMGPTLDNLLTARP